MWKEALRLLPGCRTESVELGLKTKGGQTGDVSEVVWFRFAPSLAATRDFVPPGDPRLRPFFALTQRAGTGWSSALQCLHVPGWLPLAPEPGRASLISTWCRLHEYSVCLLIADRQFFFNYVRPSFVDSIGVAFCPARAVKPARPPRGGPVYASSIGGLLAFYQAPSPGTWHCKAQN